ncbi:MAG: hypothetical protein WBQ17_11425 [Rhizomicrobium sp.]
MPAKRAATSRRTRKSTTAASKLPARIERRAHRVVAKAHQRRAASMQFGKLIATAGLLIAAAASAAIFVPKPVLRDAKDKLGRNLLPLGNRVAELAGRLAEDAEAFGKSLRG